MSVAIQLDEAYARPGVLGFGNGIASIEEIRERYREQGPIRLRLKLTAKQRDILGVLRSAGRPLSLKEMFLALDALPKTWVGYDSGGLTLALNRLKVRGLADKVAAPPSPRLRSPRVLWLITEEAVKAEGLAAVNELAGVGPDTGAHYLNRKPEARRPRRVERVVAPLRVVDQPRSEEQQAELDALIGEQKKQQRKDEYWDGERPAGTKSVFPHRFMVSFDAPAGKWRGATNAPHSWTAHHDYMRAPQRDEPLEALEQADREERLAEVLGDLDIEDVARLDDATLSHLRHRLSEEGLVSISVQRTERERLREPARHRGGYAPPPKRVARASRHRGRNEQQALMAGKRTSRKQQKRWARETGEW